MNDKTKSGLALVGGVAGMIVGIGATSLVVGELVAEPREASTTERQQPASGLRPIPQAA